LDRESTTTFSFPLLRLQVKLNDWRNSTIFHVWVQFMLIIDILEGLVIKMQDKRPSFEIMAPMSQGSHSSIELLVIGAVVASGSIQLLT